MRSVESTVDQYISLFRESEKHVADSGKPLPITWKEPGGELMVAVLAGDLGAMIPIYETVDGGYPHWLLVVPDEDSALLFQALYEKIKDKMTSEKEQPSE